MNAVWVPVDREENRPTPSSGPALRTTPSFHHLSGRLAPTGPPSPALLTLPELTAPITQVRGRALGPLGKQQSWPWRLSFPRAGSQAACPTLRVLVLQDTRAQAVFLAAQPRAQGSQAAAGVLPSLPHPGTWPPGCLPPHDPPSLRDSPSSSPAPSADQSVCVSRRARKGSSCRD